MSNLPSQAELNRLLDYNQETGKLYWKERPREMFKTDGDCKKWNTRYAGTRALDHVRDNGYLEGRIYDKLYRAHRVIFMMMHGYCPEFIDHINGNRADNRLENLREVTKSGNCKNQKLSSKNTSGTMGVFWDASRKKWGARVSTKYIGRYETKEQAVEARLAAEVAHGYHPNHGRVV